MNHLTDRVLVEVLTEWRVLVFYGCPVRKRIVGARCARMFKIENYDVAIGCTRNRKCLGRSGSSHMR